MKHDETWWNNEIFKFERGKWWSTSAFKGTGCLNKPTSNQAGGKGTSALHVSAARGDRHQTRQDAVAQGAHIVLVRDDIAQQKHGDTPSGCSQGGVHGHLRSQSTIAAGLHGQGGARVKAIPTEPKSKGAQHNLEFA